MAYHNGSISSATTQAPPIIQELEGLFENVPDEALLQALQGPTRRGPKGHPVRLLWRCFLTKAKLGLRSTADLIRLLQDNPYVASACGIDSPEHIPSEATFSRFFAKLSRAYILPLVKDVSRALVKQSYSTLPGFGVNVAVDSTDLKGWANGNRKPVADKDATWSAKNGSHGKLKWWFGYKMHLAVDCEYELPIAATVTTAKGSDVKAASALLAQCRFTYSKFHPKHIIADAGYSSAEFIALAKRQYRAQAIIKVNAAHKKALALYPETPEWKAAYNLRGAVERAFSRLKEHRALNRITVRGLPKATTHCVLSLIVMQAQAIATSSLVSVRAVA